MSYQLRQQEPVARGLRRLARNQFQTSAAALESSPGATDGAVHDARKALKKSRAILAMIEEDDGKGLGRARKQARSVNRRLSSLRDAEVSLKTLEQLQKRTSGAHNGRGLSGVHRKLAARKRELTLDARRAGTWQAAHRKLLELAKASERWRPADTGFDALSPGLRATMRRGQRALTRARKTGRASDFHEWRKELKALWYQLRLLEASDARIRQDIRRLDRAQTWLGEDHDLAVLSGELSGDSDGAASDEVRRLLAAAERRQRQLRRKAVASAAPLFRGRVGDHVNRLRLAWKRWRSRESESMQV
jgi:CHAD domain-containing protein